MFYSVSSARRHQHAGSSALPSSSLFNGTGLCHPISFMGIYHNMVKGGSGCGVEVVFGKEILNLRMHFFVGDIVGMGSACSSPHCRLWGADVQELR